MPDNDLGGRSALVTGASQGLGLSIAKSLAAAGADVFLCARSRDDLAKAVLEVEKASGRPGARVIQAACDVSRPDQVAALASEALAAFPGLTVLVSNAGIYGPMGKIEEVGWEEFTQAMETNLYGPILLARAFLPHFRRQGYGKIIQVSGGGATNPMPRLESYAASKAAVVRLFESLALDLAESRVDVNCVAPGLLDTRLLAQVIEAGPERVGEGFFRRMVDSKDQGHLTDLGIGARLCRFLASGASDGITGKLISAVWDDYEDWPNHLPELLRGDLYTLRRITGRDRGTGWGDK